MDQYGQTNDLQQAIDQVAKENAGAEAGAGAIQDELGVPPMPPTEGAGTPEAPFSEAAPMPGAPVLDETAAAPVVSTAENAETAGTDSPFPPAEPTAPVAPATEAPAEPSAEAILSEAVPESGDLAKVREGILRDLMPLMDKVNSTPEEKFDIYKDAMETLHDKSLISGAYKEATKFTDESKKADALIGLMQAIDKQ